MSLLKRHDPHATPYSYKPSTIAATYTPLPDALQYDDAVPRTDEALELLSIDGPTPLFPDKKDALPLPAPTTRVLPLFSP